MSHSLGRVCQKSKLVLHQPIVNRLLNRSIHGTISLKSTETDSASPNKGYKTIIYSLNYNGPKELAPNHNIVNIQSFSLSENNSNLDFDSKTSRPDEFQNTNTNHIPNENIVDTPVKDQISASLQEESIPDVDFTAKLLSKKKRFPSPVSSSDINFVLPRPTAVEPSIFWSLMHSSSENSVLSCSMSSFTKGLVSILEWRMETVKEIHSLANQAGLNFQFGMLYNDQKTTQISYPYSFRAFFEFDWREFANFTTAREHHLELSKDPEILKEKANAQEERLFELQSLISKWNNSDELSLKSLHKPKRFSVTDLTTQYCEPQTFYNIVFQKNGNSKINSGDDYVSRNESVKLFKKLTPYMLYDPVFDMFAEFLKQTKIKVEAFKKKPTTDSLEALLYGWFQDFSRLVDSKNKETMVELPPSFAKDYYIATTPQHTFQIFQTLLDYGKLSKRQKTFLDSGTKIHKQIEDSINEKTLLNIPDLEGASFNTSTKWGNKMLQSMIKMSNLHTQAIKQLNGANENIGKDGNSNHLEFLKLRELYVFGIHHGNVISGIIDQIGLEPFSPQEVEDAHNRFSYYEDLDSNEHSLPIPKDWMLVVTDTKTRMMPSLPPLSQRISAYHQVLIYQKLLAEMCSGEVDFDYIYKTQGIDPDTVFSWELLSFYANWSPSLLLGEYSHRDTFSQMLAEEVVSSVRRLARILPSETDFSDPENFQYLRFCSTSTETDMEYGLDRVYYYDCHSKSRQLVDVNSLSHQNYLFYQNPMVQNNAIFCVELPDITVRNIGEELNKVLSKFGGRMSEKVAVEYVFRNFGRRHGRFFPTDEKSVEVATLAYKSDKDRLNTLLDYSEQLWNGQRNPVGPPVDELESKCKYCLWANICEWKKKTENKKV